MDHAGPAKSAMKLALAVFSVVPDIRGVVPVFIGRGHVIGEHFSFAIVAVRGFPHPVRGLGEDER